MNKFVIKLIEKYQNRPNKGLNPRCRYLPTCSEYSKKCFIRFNFFKALFLTIARILRCNPLFKGRYDPAPELKPKLVKLSDSLYLYPMTHNALRINLLYIYGKDYSTIINAGSSNRHIKSFYKELKRINLPLPKYSILTKADWNYAYGLKASNTIGIASYEICHKLFKDRIILEQNNDYKELISVSIPHDLIGFFREEYRKSLYNIMIAVPTISYDDKYSINDGKNKIKIINDSLILTDNLDNTINISPLITDTKYYQDKN